MLHVKSLYSSGPGPLANGYRLVEYQGYSSPGERLRNMHMVRSVFREFLSARLPRCSSGLSSSKPLLAVVAGDYDPTILVYHTKSMSGKKDFLVQTLHLANQWLKSNGIAIAL